MKALKVISSVSLFKVLTHKYNYVFEIFVKNPADSLELNRVDMKRIITAIKYTIFKEGVRKNGVFSCNLAAQMKIAALPQC